MSFFNDIWNVLNASLPNDKIAKFNLFYDKFNSNFYKDFSSSEPIKPLALPSYIDFCEVISIHKKQKKIPQNEKQNALLHSVAHIEYSAIDIALDSCYRFRNLPFDFYYDWLEVANDEVRHFKMLCDLLEKRGIKYGDYPVHDGLFLALQKTSDNLVDRMAVLPRYMEANGLDANQYMISRLSQDPKANDDILKVLNIILDEEVSHVGKGDKWYKFACKEFNIDPKEFINIVRKHYPKAFITSRDLNEKSRIAAGFTHEEIADFKKLSRINK